MTSTTHATGTDTPSSDQVAPVADARTGMQAADLRQAVADHLRYSLGRLSAVASPDHYYRALALAVRDRMQQRWINTTQTYFDLKKKVACQEGVSTAWEDPENWTRMSILNTARSGKFSSDRAIAECWEEIWNLQPVTVKL